MGKCMSRFINPNKTLSNKPNPTNKTLYEDLNFNQPVGKLGIHCDNLNVEFYKGDFYYSDGEREIKIQPAKVKNGNFIAWSDTDIFGWTPRVEIPWQGNDEDGPEYYTVAMLHCCSSEVIEAQGTCFSNTVSEALKRKCWGGAKIISGHGKESFEITSSCFTPPFNQFIHWLVINIPAKHKNNSKANPAMKSKITNGETVIHYSSLTENMPRKGSGTHRFAFLLFKQSNQIKNRQIWMSKASKDKKSASKKGGSGNIMDSRISGSRYQTLSLRKIKNLNDLYDCTCEENVHPDKDCIRKMYTISSLARTLELGNPVKVNFFFSKNFGMGKSKPAGSRMGGSRMGGSKGARGSRMAASGLPMKLPGQ